MSSKTAKPMNDHLYRKLVKLFEAKNGGVVDFEKYRCGLNFHRVTEAALVAEIERRAQNGL